MKKEELLTEGNYAAIFGPFSPPLTVRDHSIESAMKDLWNEIGSSMREKGYRESDVEKMIKKVRSGK